MILRQCMSLPAALTSRCSFPVTLGRHKRGFQSAVCSGNQTRLKKPKPAVKKVSSRKPPPPAISVAGEKPANVYRDFSDGEDTADEGAVIHVKPSKPKASKAVKQPKFERKQLRFSDSEEDVLGEEDEDEDEDDEESEDDESKPLAPASRKGMISIPLEPDARGILYEKYVPQHLEGKPTRQLFGSNIHIRAHTSSKVLVNRVEFIKSSPDIADCPKDGFPEFSFIGRSNVGKSSLVNLLVERKKLALVSKKPGKTQLINHFLVDKNYYLVDLPGYGYANAPKRVVVDWNETTKDFFLKRKSLVMVIQLIDSSIPPQQIDIDCTTWLKTQNIPMTLAFTKCDRKKKKKNGGRTAVENVTDYLQQMRLISPQTFPWILTSCVTGQGRDDLMLHIDEYKRFWHT